MYFRNWPKSVQRKTILRITAKKKPKKTKATDDDCVPKAQLTNQIGFTWTIFRGQRNVGWNMIRPVNHQKTLLKYWSRKLAKMTVIHHAPNLCTLFENYLKCRIWLFKLWYFPLIFVLSKLTFLVTLFDRMLHARQNGTF